MEGKNIMPENEPELQADDSTSTIKIIVILIAMLMVPVFIGFLAVHIRKQTNQVLEDESNHALAGKKALKGDIESVKEDKRKMLSPSLKEFQSDSSRHISPPKLRVIPVYDNNNQSSTGRKPIVVIKSKLRRTSTMNSKNESSKTVRFALQRIESQGSVELPKNTIKLPVVS